MRGSTFRGTSFQIEERERRGTSYHRWVGRVPRWSGTRAGSSSHAGKGRLPLSSGSSSLTASESLRHVGSRGKETNRRAGGWPVCRTAGIRTGGYGWPPTATGDAGWLLAADSRHRE